MCHHRTWTVAYGIAPDGTICEMLQAAKNLRNAILHKPRLPARSEKEDRPMKRIAQHGRCVRAIHPHFRSETERFVVVSSSVVDVSRLFGRLI